MKEMMKKVRERREGFTMAELLIVVAIIAVLVAIAIPVFTSQLEKSREAVDESNLRSAYAQVSAAVLTEDLTTSAEEIGKDTTMSVTKGADGVITGVVEYKLQQSQDKLQSGETSITIGGVSIADTEFVKGATMVITVKDDGSAPTIAKKTS